MNRQEKIAGLLGDVLLPVIGFYAWHWSIYFLSLYLLLDMLFRALFNFYRAYRIQNKEAFNTKQFIGSILLFMSFSLFLILFNHSLYPEKSFLKECSHFFWYKDMGISQGFILLPLLFWGERMKFTLQMKNFSMEMQVDHFRKWITQLIAYSTLFSLLYLFSSVFELGEQLCFYLMISGMIFLTLYTDKLSAFFSR